MATTFNVPDTPVALGDSVFGPFSVPSGVIECSLHSVRTRLPDTGSLLAEAGLWMSLDGGATYTFFGSCGIIGGSNINPRTGSADLDTRFKPVPSPSLVQVRCHALVAFTLTDFSVILRP